VSSRSVTAQRFWVVRQNVGSLLASITGRRPPIVNPEKLHCYIGELISEAHTEETE